VSPRDDLRPQPPERPERPEPEADPWTDPALAAALLAVDPEGLGGAVVRARPGPAREAWLDALRQGLTAGTPLRRMPASIGDDRLLGGLDLAGTLSAGRPVWSAGLLAEADGGLVILPMAERATPGLASRLGAALDSGEVRAERDGASIVAPARFALVALDEGADPDERAPEALADRLAFRLDLTGIPRADLGEPAANAEDVAEARARLPETLVPEALAEALTKAAAALGVDSLRAPLLAMRVARAAAALLGADEAGEIEGALAARLVLGPRATRMPEPPPEEAEPEDEPPPPPEDEGGRDETPDADDAPKPLEDRVLEAAEASLPRDLLTKLAAQATPSSAAESGAGDERRTPTRGRPAGVRAGAPRGGARLDLIGTLRAAAPWQTLRRRTAPDAPGRVQVRPDDFRVKRFKRRGESGLIFVVDASGSAALARLAEVKGAVELMLAEAYVRREQVALVSFRGAGADLLLPPTRSLVQAKRRLAALPGGGGTPLAAGLTAGLALAERLKRRGVSPYLVVLTDGRANVGLDGRGGRARAVEDARSAARAVRAAGVPSVLIDASARPDPAAAALAAEMGARPLALPRADARGLADAARAATGG